MKTLERQFFRRCCKEINYEKSDSSMWVFSPRKQEGAYGSVMWEIVEEFANRKNCDEKQLYYYLEKWSRAGFYVNTSNDCILESFFRPAEMPERYLSIVPDRTWRYTTKINENGSTSKEIEVIYRGDIVTGNNKADVIMRIAAFSPYDLSPYSDETAFLSRYRCNCGKTKGKIYDGELCTSCESEVIYRDIDVHPTDIICSIDSEGTLNIGISKGLHFLTHGRAIANCRRNKIDERIMDSKKTIKDMMSCRKMCNVSEITIQLMQSVHPLFIGPIISWCSENNITKINLYGWLDDNDIRNIQTNVDTFNEMKQMELRAKGEINSGIYYVECSEGMITKKGECD